MTAKVKISQNVDIFAKVYLVHLKSQTLSNLTCSKYIYRSQWVVRFFTGKSIVLYFWGWSKPVNNAPVYTVENSRIGFDYYIYLPQKFSYSRRVIIIICSVCFLGLLPMVYTLSWRENNNYLNQTLWIITESKYCKKYWQICIGQDRKWNHTVRKKTNKGKQK